MPTTRRQVIRGSLLVAFSLAALPACSDDGPSTGSKGDTKTPQDSIAGMLSLVPDTPANRKDVTVNRFDPAWKASGFDRHATGAELDRGGLGLTIGGGTKGSTIGLAPTTFFAGNLIRPSEVQAKFGYDPGRLTADISAGAPPETHQVVRGVFDSAAVQKAVKTSVGPQATVTKIGGVEAVRWLDDLKIDMSLAGKSPLTQIGQSGRVAIPDGSTLVYARTDAGLKALAGLAEGQGTSLANAADLRAAADALDKAGAYAAWLSTERVSPTSATRGRPLTPEQLKAAIGDLTKTGQPPYAAMGLGQARDGAKQLLIVTFVHADDSTAKTGATRLTEMVKTGRSTSTAQSWSQMLLRPDITTQGRVVVGRFEVGNVTLWTRIPQQQDSLLYTA
ncbi:hypothetical protein [Luteipulveratus mongoliensis]|uniref:Lipoprotein n=1 Tax=Luteipulveratus mongoliensis TaxID=571913 RepID=A0A0K1JDP8_9MICO|nr:hypothetical protein [Luteipulveratus mongoliensis]AKU14842.1 hypothetical protein VV02_01435 [Luteipulveratus mongoliensis]